MEFIRDVIIMSSGSDSGVDVHPVDPLQQISKITKPLKKVVGWGRGEEGGG